MDLYKINKFPGLYAWDEQMEIYYRVPQTPQHGRIDDPNVVFVAQIVTKEKVNATA